jgi:hypothetical protein
MLNSIDMPVLVLIMLLGLMVRYGGWRNGNSPRGRF